ncbi:MAG: tRNA adenosine(34) deaminase TadA [Candidatus Omnitrophica bacterium]|nr:tRNA adenosine(34) deaminase TadA [Candidatus Omnitrophota bacterium]
MNKDKVYYLKEALKEAEYAFSENEVPIGAVIVYKEKIIARAYNQVEKLKDPTAHAEMIAITQATSYLNSKWLYDCILYVTVEPCLMCAGALLLSRISKVVFGTEDPKSGAFGSKINIKSLGLNHTIKIESGFLKKECAQILKDFFKKKR